MQPVKNWRLKKTLARAIDFRPIEKEDIRYAWVAYKKGLLNELSPKFVDLQMTAEEFKVAFEVHITTYYHGAWTMLADTNRGYMPTGLVVGFWSHPDSTIAPFMNVGAMIWFPWASARNRIEGAVHFFNVIRKDIRMVEYARLKDKKFFEMIARHGVMRRVGTSHVAYLNEPAAVFETR